MSKRTSVTEPVSKPKKKELEQLVVDFLTTNKDKQFNYKQISAALNIRGEDGRRVLIKALDRLRDYDVLLETSRGRYRLNNRGLILEGRFERRSNGKNFFVPDDDANVIFRSARQAKPPCSFR